MLELNQAGGNSDTLPDGLLAHGERQMETSRVAIDVMLPQEGANRMLQADGDH